MRMLQVKAAMFLLGLALIFLAVTLSGCYSWNRPAEITLSDGIVLPCSRGLTFDRVYLTCNGSAGDTLVQWETVAGYRTK